MSFLHLASEREGADWTDYGDNALNCLTSRKTTAHLPSRRHGRVECRVRRCSVKVQLRFSVHPDVVYLTRPEAQRVAIGRALLAGARFLAMDEPLSSLDLPRREEILKVVERIRDELRLPILYVTHDPAEIERLSATVVTLG